MAMEVEVEGSVSKGRRIAFTAVAAVFAAAALGLLFGFALILGWYANDDGGIHRVHYIAGFGVLSGVLITGGLLAQFRRPERNVSALLQVPVAGLGGLIGGLVASEAGFGIFVLVATAIVVGVLLALHPARSELLRAPKGFSPVLATVAVLGAIPLTSFALTMARLQRDGSPIDPHVKDSHWTAMAAMAFALILVGLLSAIKTKGWRYSARSAALGVFVLGLASVVYPHKAGSVGTGWGFVAMSCGLLFAAAAEWEAKKAAGAG